MDGFIRKHAAATTGEKVVIGIIIVIVFFVIGPLMPMIKRAR